MSSATEMMLRSIGYCYDTPSYQDLVEGAPVAEKPYGYCRWLDCGGWKRYALPGARRCPDCGHELTWMRNLKPRDERLLNISKCTHNWILDGKVEVCATCGVQRERLEQELSGFGGKRVPKSEHELRAR